MKLQWATMLLNSCQKPTHYKKKQRAPEKSTSDELVIKAKYMNCMQDKKKLYWKQSAQQETIIVKKRTIVHPCLDVMTITNVKSTKKCFQ